MTISPPMNGKASARPWRPRRLRSAHRGSGQWLRRSGGVRRRQYPRGHRADGGPAGARAPAGWPVAHSRIVFADDDADHNIFTLKVPGMLTLKEADHNSAIVPQLAPASGELVVRKTVPSAFFGTSLAAWLSQRGVQTLLVAGAVTSGCVRPAWWTPCSTAFARWWCRTAWATAPSARTRPIFRHAAEVRHRADAGRSPAGDAGLVGSR